MQDSHTSESAQSAVEDAIISGILSARIRPGTRLSENQLASLFSVSRTRIREAMMRLETRGIVTVSPRRGWFVVEPSAEESIKVYEARRIIEYGLCAIFPASARKASPSSPIISMRRRRRFPKATASA